MTGTPTAAQARARSGLRGLLAAVCFLTRLPLGRWVVLDADDVTRAGPAFPLVGAGIGAAVGALAAGLAGPLSPLLAVAVALACGTVLTGALHLDALADTADALGAHSRERALAIMREPTIGAFGAVAIALDLLLKAAALSVLMRDERIVRFAVAAGALSRLAPVLLSVPLDYARAGQGLGDALTRGGGLRAAVAGLLALAIAVAVAGVDGAALAASTAVLTVLLGVGYRRWLGGVTGDALGAALELSETFALILAVALVGGR